MILFHLFFIYFLILLSGLPLFGTTPGLIFLDHFTGLLFSGPISLAGLSWTWPESALLGPAQKNRPSLYDLDTDEGSMVFEGLVSLHVDTEEKIGFVDDLNQRNESSSGFIW